MKKLIAGFALTSALAFPAFGADVTGYIIDKNCSHNRAMFGNEACALRCMGRGEAAVLATEDGQVYAITNKDKVKDFAGKKVTVSGKVEGESITVAHHDQHFGRPRDGDTNDSEFHENPGFKATVNSSTGRC